MISCHKKYLHKRLEKVGIWGDGCKMTRFILDQRIWIGFLVKLMVSTSQCITSWRPEYSRVPRYLRYWREIHHLESAVKVPIWKTNSGCEERNWWKMGKKFHKTWWFSFLDDWRRPFWEIRNMTGVMINLFRSHPSRNWNYLMWAKILHK